MKGHILPCSPSQCMATFSFILIIITIVFIATFSFHTNFHPHHRCCLHGKRSLFMRVFIIIINTIVFMAIFSFHASFHHQYQFYCLCHIISVKCPSLFSTQLEIPWCFPLVVVQHYCGIIRKMSRNLYSMKLILYSTGGKSDRSFHRQLYSAVSSFSVMPLSYQSLPPPVNI